MNDSLRIINGIKTNDEATWKALYDEFMPIALSYVRRNSGSYDDAKDLLQNTFVKFLLKCREGFEHDNIKALIARRLKWDWLDYLRANNKIHHTQIQEKHEKTYISAYNFWNLKKLRGNLTENLNISRKLISYISKSYEATDYLEYDNLNDVQKLMVELLLDTTKTSAKCRKLLLMTEFLPVSDTEFIALEMGYITEPSESGIIKGKKTLKTMKNRCLVKFKLHFNKLLG